MARHLMAARPPWEGGRHSALAATDLVALPRSVAAKAPPTKALHPTDSSVCGGLLRLGIGFALQQRRLAFQAPAVAAEDAIAGDHPVAGHQQAQRVAGAGAGHGAWVAAQLRGQLGVVARLPDRDLLQGAPYLLLKRCAANIQWQLGSALRFADLRQYLAQAVAL